MRGDYLGPALVILVLLSSAGAWADDLVPGPTASAQLEYELVPLYYFSDAIQVLQLLREDAEAIDEAGYAAANHVSVSSAMFRWEPRSPAWACLSLRSDTRGVRHIGTLRGPMDSHSAVANVVKIPLVSCEDCGGGPSALHSLGVRASM